MSAMSQSRVAWFKEVLEKYKRVAIFGAPRSGKTTLSRQVAWSPSRTVIHTDAYKDLPWSEASEFIANMANATKRALIVEGVRVPHALRKGMRCDAVIVLDVPLVELTKGQETMRKSGDTVFKEWRAANPDVPVLVAPPAAKDFREDEDEEEEKTNEA